MSKMIRYNDIYVDPVFDMVNDFAYWNIVNIITDTAGPYLVNNFLHLLVN